MDIHCKRATELISDSMHRTLSRYERVCLALHLVVCKACRAYRRQVRLIEQALRDSDATLDEAIGSTGGTLSPEARRRIAEALRERES